MNVLIGLSYVYFGFGVLLALALLYDLWCDKYNPNLFSTLKCYMGIYNTIILKLLLSLLIIISIMILPILFILDKEWYV